MHQQVIIDDLATGDFRRTFHKGEIGLIRPGLCRCRFTLDLCLCAANQRRDVHALDSAIGKFKTRRASERLLDIRRRQADTRQRCIDVGGTQYLLLAGEILEQGTGLHASQLFIHREAWCILARIQAGICLHCATIQFRIERLEVEHAVFCLQLNINITATQTGCLQLAHTQPHVEIQGTQGIQWQLGLARCRRRRSLLARLRWRRISRCRRRHVTVKVKLVERGRQFNRRRIELLDPRIALKLRIIQLHGQCRGRKML